MGTTPSRPQDDDLGIAELFAPRRPRTGPIRYLLVLAHKLAIATRLCARPRIPTTAPQLERFDSVGEMRAVLSALGGWNEHQHDHHHYSHQDRRRMSGSIVRLRHHHHSFWG